MVSASFYVGYVESLLLRDLQERRLEIVLHCAKKYLPAVFCAKDNMVTDPEYNSPMVNGFHVMGILQLVIS
jgi:hypothetical protein